jgi:hypothetical protein
MERETIHTNGPKLLVTRITLGGGDVLQRMLPKGYKVWLIVSSGVLSLRTGENELELKGNDRVQLEGIDYYELHNKEVGSLCVIETEFDDRE